MFGHDAQEETPDRYLRDGFGRIVAELVEVRGVPAYQMVAESWGGLEIPEGVECDPSADWDDFDEDPEAWAPLDCPAPDEDPADFAPTDDDAAWWAEQSRGDAA